MDSGLMFVDWRRAAMARNLSNDHLATIIIGVIIIIVALWMYITNVDYRYSNQNAEESYIAIKEDYIQIQVNRTIQMIDNYMKSADDLYQEQLIDIAEAIQNKPDELNGYITGTISLEALVEAYTVLNPIIGYAVIDSVNSDLIESSKTVASDRIISDSTTLREVVELGEGKELILYLLEEDLIDLVKMHVIPTIREIRLQDNGYIWVNEVVNYNGGDDYAIRRIHANLQDTEGQYLTTKAQDAYGNFPYQIELDGIKAYGEITFEYYFKKMESEVVSRKMSYAKLYEPFDWIVATGVHLDDLEAYIDNEKQDRTRNFRIQLFLTVLILLALIIIFIWKMRLSLELIRYRSRNIELTEALKREAKELEDALMSLQEAEEELIDNAKRTLTTQLVAGVAHEINTPLGLSLTCTTHLRDNLDGLVDSFNNGTLSKAGFVKFSSILIESAEMTENNIQRAIGLIENFKHVAVDMTTNERREFEVCGYIKNVIDNIDKSVKHGNYLFDMNCTSKVIIDSYPGALYQVMTNLMMNSVSHGFKGRNHGHVIISISSVQESVKIIYQDDGIGISEENLGNIFEPFYTTGKIDGNTGLGLYIVSGLVQTTLGGSIGCESSLGNGCIITIEIPKVAPDEV